LLLLGHWVLCSGLAWDYTRIIDAAWLTEISWEAASCGPS
jgi:hypothetical protein